MAGGAAGGAIQAGGAAAGQPLGGGTAGGSAFAGGSGGGVVAGGGVAGGRSSGGPGGGSGAAGGRADGGVGDAGTTAGGAAGGADAGRLPGDLCESATPIDAGILNSLSLSGFVNDYAGPGFTSACANRSTGPDRVFSLAVPPMTAAVLETRPTALLNVNISLVLNNPALCTLRECVNSHTLDYFEGVPDRAYHLNATALTQTLFIVVDSTAPSPMGTFTLAVHFYPLSTDGDDCSTAPPLPLSGTLEDQTLFLFGDTWNSAPCGFLSYADRAYSVSVPARSRLTVNGYSIQTTLYQPLLVAFESLRACQYTICYQSPSSRPALSLDNPSGVPKEFFVAVEWQASPDYFPLYWLSLQTTPLASPDAGP